jgi:hypothetical protein
MRIKSRTLSLLLIIAMVFTPVVQASISLISNTDMACNHLDGENQSAGDHGVKQNCVQADCCCAIWVMADIHFVSQVTHEYSAVDQLNPLQLSAFKSQNFPPLYRPPIARLI